METAVTHSVLRTHGVQKRFGSVQALSDIDFDLAAGEVRALLGVNGAGKSTLAKILSGLYHRDGGTIEIDGKPVELNDPHAARAAGVASVQQRPELIPGLTGYENICLGQEAGGRTFARFSQAELQRRAEALAGRIGLSVDLTKTIAGMSAVEREIVAILQALAVEGIRVLILDEPTSVLTEREKGLLFKAVALIKAQGIGVIYITHRLDEVFSIADSFTVFRGGQTIATESVANGKHNVIAIAEMMLGSGIGEIYPARALAPPGDVVLAVKNLAVGNVLEGISLEARKGMILGVFGLLGSGLEELSKVLFGAITPSAGEIRVHGATVRLSSPKEALARGIFLVPADRLREGLVLTRDVAFNTTLANLSEVSVGGFLRAGRARSASDALAGRVDLTPPSTRRLVSAFSGGNQQKIVIAKGLFAKADVYIFAEPTMGVDIGARAKIYSLIRELSTTAAVIVMSSDADEAYGLSDHIMALYKGRVALDAAAVATSRHSVLAAGLSGGQAE
jgi:ABC-type sugar transport system ATPase subunit